MPTRTSPRRTAGALGIICLATCLLLAPTMALSQSALDIVVQHFEQNRQQYDLVGVDLSNLEVTDQFTTSDTGVTHIYLRQQINGIEVINSHANANILPDGTVLSANAELRDTSEASNAEPNGTGGASRQAATPELTASEAAERVAEQLGLKPQGDVTVQEDQAHVEGRQLLSAAGISREAIPSRLVYTYVPKAGHRLSWELLIDPVDRASYLQIAADASNGVILFKADWVVNERSPEPAKKAPEEASADPGAQPEQPSLAPGLQNTGASYRVFPPPYESPNDPGASHTLTGEINGPTGSHTGWHDTDGAPGAEYTITRGNNVHAYLDADDNNSPDTGSSPDGGAGLVFDFTFDPLEAPTGGTNAQASVVNLFFWNNVAHDVLYAHGFDEVSGNFQVNNYGLGGVGGDDVRAEGLDGSGTDNANFFTPPEGQRARMQMYEFTDTTPHRDSSFDAGLIIHEYGHGWSNRLTGGPARAGCLNNGEQMGEGWSDFLATVFTAKASDNRTTPRGVATYLLGQPTDGDGFRPAPYTTDMGVNPYTYENRADGDIWFPHGLGFIWNTMLWEMYWNLVDAHGFNPELRDDWTTGGNNLALRLVTDGLKMQSCAPGFTDGRDAILAADKALTGGENQCFIWKAFAKRGLGVSASQGSPYNRSDGNAAFDMPEACEALNSQPRELNVCQGQPAEFELAFGNLFTQSINLSTDGVPAEAASSFSANPVSPGDSSVLTINNTGAVPPGSYALQVEADDGILSEVLGLNLSVSGEVPEPVTLHQPSHAADNMGTTPTLSWQPTSPGSSYLVEVAKEPDFAEPVFSQTTQQSSLQVTGLEGTSIYYWRVTASNGCGKKQTSATRAFRTETLPGACPVGDTPAALYEEDFEAGLDDWTTGGIGPTWSDTEIPEQSTGAFAAGRAAHSDQRLTSPELTIPTGYDSYHLTFWHAYAIEDWPAPSVCLDGAMIEVSDDNGSGWSRVESSTHPYTYSTISTGNPLHPARVWCGTRMNWHRPAFDLSAYAGDTIQFRFRLGTDSGFPSEGWHVDNVAVRGCTAGAAEFTVGGSVNGLDGQGLVVVDDTGEELTVNADGSFVFTAPRVYADDYSVSVLTQPNSPKQLCTVSNSGGTVIDSDISSVAVSCDFQGVQADAGSPQTAMVGNTVVLNGNGSADLDGNTLSYAWTQTGGPAVQLDDPTASQPQFSAPAVPATLHFELTVDNGYGFNNSDTVAVDVSNATISALSASNNGPVRVRELVTFEAAITTGSNVSYSWDFGDGSSGTGAQPTHIYVEPGSYTATVTASNANSSMQAQTQVTVRQAFALPALGPYGSAWLMLLMLVLAMPLLGTRRR